MQVIKKKSDGVLRAMELVEDLTIPELQLIADHLQSLLKAKEIKAIELMTQLRDLGVQIPVEGDEQAVARRAKPSAKYRSRQDPTLTWAGRGHVAGWLRREMAEYNLPLEAFSIQTSEMPKRTHAKDDKLKSVRAKSNESST